ncbi:MAG: hypothetical protein R3E66_17175 [bacterium]
MLKTAILGGLMTMVGLVVGSVWFGMSVAVGTVITLSNLRVVEWVSTKLLRAAKQGNTSSAPWTILLVLKLFAIFALIWFLLARVFLDPVGFVAGFSCFLPAIVWQAVLARDGEPSDSGN